MSSPLNQQDETAVTATRSDRYIFYYSIIVAIIVTAALVAGQFALNYQDESGKWDYLNPAIIGFVWMGVWFIWRGKAMWGTSIIAIMLYAGVGFTISQSANVGAILAVSITFNMAALFVYTWSRRLLTSSLLGLTLIGVLLLLADLYWPVPRPAATASMQYIVYIGSGIIIVTLLILVIRRFPGFAIRGKLVVTFLAVTVASLASMVILNSLRTQAILVDNANQILLTAASQTAVNLDDFLTNTQNDIRTEAGIMGNAYDWAYYRRLPIEEQSSALGILGETKAVELLKTYRDKDPLNIASYALLDMNGQIAFEYPPNDHNPDESNRSYFTAVLETGLPYISPVEFSSENGEAYLTFSALVFDDAGERFGVLRGQYKASVLQTLIARSTGLVGGQSFAVLFDENHLHLAHGAAPDVIYKLTSLPDANKVAALQASQRLPNWPLEELSTNLPDLETNLSAALDVPLFTATDVATESRTNYVAVSLMNEQPWLVAFFQPQDVFLAPIQEQFRRTILLVLVITGAVVGIAIIVSNFIARPIVRLEAIATRIAQGDLTAQAQVEAQDEIGALAHTFNLMTEQLRDLIATLEHRVAERTHALEISSDVSRRLSTILNQQELVQAVVDQVQQAFDYYHAHIYLFDDLVQNLIMVGGTGEAGQQMLANQHQIPVGKGLVGRAGQSGEPVLVPDTAQAEDWLPNPLLPDTKAEIAVPIMSGDRVLGVLDVQHNVTDGLDQADVDLLVSIANQVSVALRNANQYEEAQQQVQREALMNEINQKILNTKDVQEAMQVAVREIGRALNASQTIVRFKQTGPLNSQTVDRIDPINGANGQKNKS